MRITAVILCIVLFFEALYCFFVFTDIPSIKTLRNQFISTAISTMSHQWLAKAFLPEYMVAHVQQNLDNFYQSQEGINSDDSDRHQPTTDANNSTVNPFEDFNTETTPLDPDADPKEEAFFSLFYELNRSSFEAYADEHPEVLANGWENVYINEAGIDDEGTEIYTTMGEQVLAIDAKNQILLVRVTGTGYQGVLAIAKDPSQLRCEPSAGIGSYGQTLDQLVSNNGGILGMNGSGFYDPDGRGSGGVVAGTAVCNGVRYDGAPYGATYKRLELSENNKFYIVDTFYSIGEDVTDAVEFSPALIIDGEMIVSGFSEFDGIHPRAAIGQSSRGEILMLVIEGRQVTRSMGTNVETCANILMRHSCYTAMNLDGGTSAVMWYDGEYVTVCSNPDISSRSLPNAWVYGNFGE